MLDKLFDVLSAHAKTSEVGYYELKLRRIMELLADQIF
jgi:hypothetical protein